MELLLASVLFFSWLVFLFEKYLQYRQHHIYQTCSEVPVEIRSTMDKDCFERSRFYNLDCSWFGFIRSFASQIEETAVLLLGGIPFLWRVSGQIATLTTSSSNEIVQSVVFTLLGSLYSSLMNLPWDLYRTFVIEERHGFNKQTLGFYIKDTAKKFLVSCTVLVPITIAVIKIIQLGGAHSFIYASFFMLFVSLFLITVYQDYIAPLFDQFMPLPAGGLRDSIYSLASKLSFPLADILVIEGSKRSSHSNAYFIGLITKKIVLFDTLLEESPFKTSTKESKEPSGAVENTAELAPTSAQNAPQAVTAECGRRTEKDTPCTETEVLAILGHELGHWKHNHMLKGFIITQLNMLFCFYTFGLLMYSDYVYQVFGFRDQRPIVIGLIVVFSYILAPYREVLNFVLVVLSRYFEYQADHFAVRLGMPHALRGALLKLLSNNLSFPMYDKWYSTFNHTHPPILDRIKALDSKQD